MGGKGGGGEGSRAEERGNLLLDVKKDKQDERLKKGRVCRPVRLRNGREGHG